MEEFRDSFWAYFFTFIFGLIIGSSLTKTFLDPSDLPNKYQLNKKIKELQLDNEILTDRLIQCSRKENKE